MNAHFSAVAHSLWAQSSLPPKETIHNLDHRHLATWYLFTGEQLRAWLADDHREPEGDLGVVLFGLGNLREVRQADDTERGRLLGTAEGEAQGVGTYGQFEGHHSGLPEAPGGPCGGSSVGR